VTLRGFLHFKERRFGLHPLLVEGTIRWGSEFDDHDRAPDYGIDQTRPRFRLPEWMEDKRI
jgi:hypothetical protein